MVRARFEIGLLPSAVMTPRVRTWTLLALAVLAVVGGAYWLQAEREADVARDAEAARVRREARQTRTDARWSNLRAESRELMPDLLADVELGMTLAEARRLRPGLTTDPSGQSADEPTLHLWEERFPNGARAVYAFERDSGLLQRVQVLSLLPDSSAVAPHLAAMNERYGSPTGVWDCPNTGGVPTRRFTWRHGHATVSDVFLIYGGRVSVTLYIAPNQVILRSLQRSSCSPVRAEDLARFPVTTPEALNVPGSD